jgi:hypothetical protein
MTRTRLAIVLSLLAAIPATSGLAETPLGTTFGYEGDLAYADGTPLEGTFDLRFILYDAGTGGNQIGPIVFKANRVVTQGHYSVQLNFGSAFVGNRRWLETAWRPGDSVGDYTTETPRQELTAVSSSLYAGTAWWGGVMGKPAGFADDVDNDTTYTAGAGLQMDASNGISIASGGVMASMLSPGVDNRYVNEDQVRAGVDSTPTMCNNTEPVIYSLPWFSQAPAVVISPAGQDNFPGNPPNTYCVLLSVTNEAFRYCCIGQVPDSVRWIAITRH